MREGGVSQAPYITYICGFLLSQLQLLLGIFKSLGVFVEFILSALQFLLQCEQIILKLRVIERLIDSSEGRETECAGGVARKGPTEKKRRKEREVRTGIAQENTLVATSSAVRSFSSTLWYSSSTLSRSSSVTRNLFSN